YIGVLLFIILGSNHLPKARRQKQAEINAYILETTEGAVLAEEIPDAIAPLARLNRTLGSMPLVSGNSATLLTDYDASLQEMVDAIAAAKRYVHCEFYI